MRKQKEHEAVCISSSWSTVGGELNGRVIVDDGGEEVQ
jgi:hypothetical protein